ncbi:MAG: phage tail protein [Candidatus Sulfopaludibacter sp.]|nr:phage tail protein [Candidatus Sulfopaludibacter sp.]
MQTISELKEQAVSDTPLIVFDCLLANGQCEHWSTHAVTVGGTSYAARVLNHSAFEIQTASDQGVDGSPAISIVLANADSHFSEIERSTGWKGAKLTVGFLFYDLRNGAPLTDVSVVFQGVCNPPDQIKEATFRMTASNRMNLQRLLLPEVRIQRRCPWTFPSTTAQQLEAVDGGPNGRYSRYYRCGYSAGLAGGAGNLNGAAPFTSCGYSRDDCQARGMFRRFGGLEFVPPVIAVRGYGKDWSTSSVSLNQARYNDFVPMIYGTAWYEPLVVFARNDGNLTRMEVLLGIGEMNSVLTVLVSGVEIPVGVPGTNMTGTGWYSVPTLGTRNGTCDGNFVDGGGNPAGDPYGSMAYLSVVVPNSLNNGNSLPNVKVLAQGLLVPVYTADGAYVSDQFSSNPAWILLDLLRRSGWSTNEIDVASFAAAAAYCEDPIPSLDLNGNTIAIPRFQCNVVIQKRKSAGDVIRGIRNSARLYLTYGPSGTLQLEVENTVPLQQPSLPAGSNSTQPLNGGWPSYEFGDGSNGSSGILRRQNGEPSVAVSSRSIADTPNCYTVDFQDALNGYQQDSYSVIDPDDVALAGQQVTATLMAAGLANYDQAGRILKFNLDKSVRGNTCVEFETSVKGFGIRPGDLITFTYLKEGFIRQPFRVRKISPATNYRTTAITAQIHDDAWYTDSNGQPASAPGSSQQANSGVGIPRPLLGSMLDGNGDVQFGIVESDSSSDDGTVQSVVSVNFIAPAAPASAGPGVPLVGLTPELGAGGSLKGGAHLYYAVSAVDSGGSESPLSFLVRAEIVSDNSQVTICGLSFPSGAVSFHVYRGTTPAALFRIASNQPIASQFVDAGLADQLVAPPDANFDHANFYWRMELQPEIAVRIHSPNTAGNQTLAMAVNAYRGMNVRITRGTGAGQEQCVAANDATTLTMARPWAVEPDATSFFAVAEAGWHFGALTKSSPVQFTIPNQSGAVVEVTGRSANVNDVECSAALSTVTPWQIGGSGYGDTDVPPAPALFGLSPTASGGIVCLSGVSFNDLTNTQTVSAATVTMYCWDELQGPTPFTMAAQVADVDTMITLNAAGTAQVGSMIQIEAEVVVVTAIANDANRYTVTRGMHGTHPASHAAATPVYHLTAKTVIAPFPDRFFGSPYSGNWSFPIVLPDVRIASAQIFVTNQKGNSPSASIFLTHSADSGLRTYAGGQYSLQVDGYLAVDQSATPAVVVDSQCSVRDVYGVLGTAADAPVEFQVDVNGVAYCQCTFQPGMIVSNSVSGFGLPPLPQQAQITLSVLSVGQTYPGADLTVVIRL